jgi:hypothetical protein
MAVVINKHQMNSPLIFEFEIIFYSFIQIEIAIAIEIDF